MVASIGAVASASQGVSYYERDGYYASDDPAHQEASAWTGRGAGALGLSGAGRSGRVQGRCWKAVSLTVPDNASGRRRNGKIVHRPGRDLTLSAPKSVSLAALVGGDERIVAAHDRAVKRTLGWVERHVVETRLRDPKDGPDGARGRAGNGGRHVHAITPREIWIRNFTPTPCLPTC